MLCINKYMRKLLYLFFFFLILLMTRFPGQEYVETDVQTRDAYASLRGLPLNSNLNSLSPLYLGTLQQLILTTKRMVTRNIRNRGHTRTAGPRYDDWSGTADRGGDSDDDGDGTGAFSAQQAPRPGGLLVDSVGAFLFAPVRAACRSLPDDIDVHQKQSAGIPTSSLWTTFFAVKTTTL